MTTLTVIFALVLGLVGIVGSVVPGLPGPPLSWAGLLLMYIADRGVSITCLLLWLLVTVLVTVLDYFVPAMFTKFTGGSKYAGRGAIVGLLVGLFLAPVGVILGSLLGAFLAELLFARKDFMQSVSAAFGALLGFLCGTGIKLIASGLMLYYIIVYI